MHWCLGAGFSMGSSIQSKSSPALDFADITVRTERKKAQAPSLVGHSQVRSQGLQGVWVGVRCIWSCGGPVHYVHRRVAAAWREPCVPLSDALFH